MARKQSNPAPRSQDERRGLIDSIVQDAAGLYGPGCVEYSEKTQSSYILRRPTGILSVDIAMAGGFPASAPSVLVGPDGAGKDYLLWRTAAEVQRIYGEDFVMACYFTEFKPDKPFMKDICGLQIAMSEQELEDLDRARHAMRRPKLTPQEIDHYRYQVGTFCAIYGISADHGFDQIFRFIKANVCQLVAVNSIGFLQTEAKEAVDSYEEFAQQRNEATLLSKALPQFAMHMNHPDENGLPNETTLILVNQVRSKDQAARVMPGRPLQAKDTYKTASNSWALKHGKAIELFVHNGPVIYDESAKPPFPIGRKKSWELTKGKLGTHEGIKGEFNFLFHKGADVESDLVNVATQLGIIESNGAWYSYDDGEFRFKVQGAAGVARVLEESPGLLESIRIACFNAAGTTCRYR